MKSESFKGKILVTSYKNPDLDGTACMIAYSKLLKELGIDTESGYFGKLNPEAKYVLEKFEIPFPKKGDNIIEDSDGIVIVDNVNPDGLSDKIDLKKVIEIIDHHYSERNLLENYPNVKGQIEKVGAAATLIVERHMDSKVTVDKDSAILLYGAIISNTLNFKSNTTTERDKKAAEWLKDFVNIPDNFVRDMFGSKSDLSGKNMYKILSGDLKQLTKESLYIAQLEIIDLEKTLNERKEELIKALQKIKKDNKGRYIFLTGMDLEKGFNIFMVVDEDSKKLLEDSLELEFTDNVAKREGLMMRKELIPIIKSYL
ncbi:MAG: hypothetical protein GF368_04970 [Candidatus Aenigmarchaeota archaeon]|nr:hypothetical protein [Candidatus Aenigmarchaeota archaeon]